MTTIARKGKQPEPCLFRGRDKKKPGGEESPDTSSAAESDSAADDSILCRSCRSPVTSHHHAISVNDCHLHTFFNPAGVVYEIRCFGKAGGTTIYGEPTSEFSWFAGCTWQYALCAACLEHLGWLFSGAGDSFYGLIRSRLVSGE